MKSRSQPALLDHRLAQVAGDAQALRQATEMLRARAQGGPDDASVLGRMAAMLNASGRTRPDAPGFALEVEREAFLRRFGRIVLPERAVPCASLVLMAVALAPSVAMIEKLVPILADTGMELLLADAGDDPRIRLLPIHIAELRVIVAGNAPSACNLAVAAARGSSVALLSGPAVAADVTPPPGVTWVGAAGRSSLARWGVNLRPAPTPRPGLAIATSRANWIAASGMDARMDDGCGLEIADLALRLHRAGHVVLSCDASQAAEGVPADPERQWQGMRQFRARWGDHPAAGFDLS